MTPLSYDHEVARALEPVSFVWNGEPMTATPPDWRTLGAIARRGRAATTAARSIVVGLELLRRVLGPNDYRRIETDLAAGGDVREMTAVVRYLAGLWSIDPRSVAESN